MVGVLSFSMERLSVNVTTKIAALLMVFGVLCGRAALAEDLWIDVRSPEEFSAAHLDQAVNIPHTDIGKRIAELAPDKNAAIHLYCKSGRRAGLAKETLEQLGYTRVSNAGGLEDARAERARQP